MSIHHLVAWAGDRRVGVLGYRDHAGLFSFAYDPEWVAYSNSYVLSPSLPFQRPEGVSDELHSQSVRRFFENLLPEGQALDDAVAVHRVSKTNIYALLRELGKESAGVICLLAEGMSPEQAPESIREITHAELSERIRDRENQPFHVWDGRIRMSIAGYQDKVAVYLDDDLLYLVEGRLASTHILKPEPLNPKMPNLVANEYFSMRLAAELGLPTAPVDILRVPEAVLIVERFDRRRLGGRVERYHMIDACQALDVGVTYKYERNFGNGSDVAHIRDGVSLLKVFSLASQAISEASARMGMLRWALVQYLLGNSDAHGKNISFMVEAGGLRLAPAYDLVSVSMYPDFEQEMAMAIGDEFDIHKVRAFDWAELAQECGIERRLMVREMRRMIKAARKIVPKLAAWPGYTDTERGIVDKIADFVLGQAKQMEKDAELIPEVELE